MINRITLLVLSIATIGFASCKKDKSNPGPDPDPTPVEKKLTSIEENGVRTASFTYNADGTLKEIQAFFDPGNATTFVYTYNAQKKPVELVSDEGYKVKYVYENGVLRLTENYDGAQKVSENSFVYENGKMKSNTMLAGFPQPDGSILYKPTFRVVYTYNANGSVQKISNYVKTGLGDNLELEDEYVYMSYDSKKNPFSVIADFSQVLLFQPVHINNPLTEKYLDAAGATLETTENVYTYDAAGYPLTVKSTVTPTGGTATVTNTKFNY